MRFSPQKSGWNGLDVPEAHALVLDGTIDGRQFALVRLDDHLAWLGSEHQLPELSELLEGWFVKP